MTPTNPRQSEPEISLVIPAFEEVERLPPFLSELAQAVADNFPMGRIEILVVDDGSSSTASTRMASEVAKVAEYFHFVKPMLRLAQNQGKGGAVYSGWNTVGKETRWVAFVDADGAVSAEETVRLLTLAFDLPVGESHVAFFALRDMKNRHSVRRTVVRGILGRVFAGCVKALMNLPVADTQCGLKIVPNKVFAEIQASLTEMRFCFDIELTALMVRAGVEIRGIPIAWEESPGSKVRLGSAIRMLFSLLAIRSRLAFSEPMRSSRRS